MLDGDRVRWVVTRADLRAPAIGIVVLAFLTVMGLGLRRLVLHHLSEGWLSHRSESRRIKAETEYGEQRKRNTDIGQEDCLKFPDWIDLAAISTA